MTCTWKDCLEPATTPMKNDRGQQWADLCDEHKAQFDRAVMSGCAKKVLQAWLSAKGGKAT